MMHRNLDRRVESLVRLTSPEHIQEIEALFDLAFSEKTEAWLLDGDGAWTRNHLAEDGHALVNLQEELLRVHGKRRARVRR